MELKVSINMEFSYHPSQRALFADGSLVKKWKNAYSDMFDEHDYRLAISQHGHHFFEWLSAVLLREATGYHSLIEKYETKKHVRKVAVFKETVNPDVFELAMSHPAGLSDLFVYRPGTHDWFFCEVKGGVDTLSSPQIEMHKTLELRSGRKVRVLCLRALA